MTKNILMAAAFGGALAGMALQNAALHAQPQDGMNSELRRMEKDSCKGKEGCGSKEKKEGDKKDGEKNTCKAKDSCKSKESCKSKDAGKSLLA